MVSQGLFLSSERDASVSVAATDNKRNTRSFSLEGSRGVGLSSCPIFAQSFARDRKR